MMQLAWFIPLLPLIGFLFNGLGFPGFSRNLAAITGCTTVLASFGIVISYFIQSLAPGWEPLRLQLFDWIVAGDLSIGFSFWIDQLTLIMLLVVTGVGFLIHVYSAGYMQADEGFGKFFAYLNLFIFFMLILVMGGNYVVMFIGWEGVGLCSYLLIGFWWKNRDFSAAANKAFIMNRIGDLGFILGIFLLFITFGSSDFGSIAEGSGAFRSNDEVIIAITLLLFLGAVGKSAQIPLFTWLPDAMAGPTPVSALIHAATMVTAGVYMVARSHMLYALAPLTLEIITAIGLATAVLSALIALTQNDIKKVLAYSTVSQLGYMFVAEGSGAFSSGIFHLFTHAFFKALLFLGAGSVIHALHHEQDMRKMGGLKKKLPITYITMGIATLAITGVPPFSGFFSKDEILVASYETSSVAFWLLSITSVLTAAYMFRLLLMTFWGRFRGIHKVESHITESPKVMTWPLIILAAFAACSGFLGLPSLFSGHHWMKEYLHPVFSQNPRIVVHEPSHAVEIGVMSLAVIALAVVLYFAYRKYHLQPVPADMLIEEKPFLYRLSYHKFYVDELYERIIIKPLLSLGDAFKDKMEPHVIDGFVNSLGSLALWLSGQLRKLQTGSTGFYVLAMVAGMVLILLIGLSKMNLF